VVTAEQAPGAATRMGTSADRDAREGLVSRRQVRCDWFLWRAAAVGGGWLALFAVLVWVGKGRPAFGEVVGNVVYLVPDVLCVILAVVAASVSRGRARLMWTLLAGHNMVQLTGDVAWAGYAYLTADGLPFPSWADVAYLSAYLLAVPAILVGFGGANRVRRTRGLLDTALVLVGVGAVGWQVFVGPQLGGSLTLAGATGAAYPLADSAVVGCLIAIGLSGHRMVPYAVLLAGAAFATNAATDLGYTYLTLFAAYEDDSWLNLAWQGAAVLFCLAALVTIRHREADARVEQLDRDLAFLPVLIGTAAACGLIAVDAARDGRIGSGSLVVAGLMIAGLLLRQWMTTSDRTRLATRLQAALREQERLAVTDALTGLYNRRFFQEMLRLEADRASRQAGSLSLVVLDLDHFKLVNDTYGHPVGDVVLMQASDRIRQAARSSDIVARYGGEEFVCLAPGTDEQAAVELAERFRQALRRAPIPSGTGVQLSLTVSVGVATARCGDGPLDVERLINDADSALYQAKSSGRDRVVRAGDPQHVPTAAHGAPAAATDTDTDTAVARWCQLVGHRLGRAAAALAAAGGAAHRAATATIADALPPQPDQPTSQPGLPVRRPWPDPGPPVDADHERRDDGHHTEQISIEMRIVAVCDSWAAMRTDHTPLTADQARQQLQHGREGLFDPGVVDAFLALLDEGAIGQPMPPAPAAGRPPTRPPVPMTNQQGAA
jgi:two-component system cell cycle response regulator